MKPLHEIADELCPYRLDENPVAADSMSDPIELCGLLWDRDNLTIGGYEKDGHHYYTWQEAMDAARSVGSGETTTRTTRARCFSLLRACSTAIAASWPARALTATIGPRRRTTEATTARAPSASTRATSTH